MMLGAIALGQAMQVNNGFYQRIAMVWLTLALAFCIAGVVAMRFKPGLSTRANGICRGIAAAGLLWQLLTLLVSEPGLAMRTGTSLRFLEAGTVLQAIAIVAGFMGIGAAKRLWFPALLVVTLVVGFWMVRVTP